MPNHYLSQETLDEQKKLLGDSWFLATNAQWQATKTHYEKVKRQATANLNAARFSQASEEEKAAQKAQIEQQIETLNTLLFLIEFSIVYDPQNRTGNFYSRLIEGLLKFAEDETINKQEINKNINILLKDFLTVNPQEAIEYYASFLQIKVDATYTENEHGDLVYPYLPIMVHFGSSVVDYYLITLDKVLLFQSPAEGIINLINSCVENPPLFAALLIWVLNKGVKPNALINAGLLHTYMKAYIYDITRENSPINLLFKWLEIRKENLPIISLINLAATISCKSTDCTDMRGFEHYALTGHKSGKGEKRLKEVFCQLPDLNLSPNHYNFAKLYAHFDLVFLERILDYLSNKICRKEYDQETIDFLIPAIISNGSEAIFELIKRFSKVCSEGKRELLFKALDSVLSYRTITDLLEEDVSAICIAQHGCWFSDILKESDSHAFAERIIQSKHHIIDKIEYLVILINNFSNNTMLFQHVLNYFLLTEENVKAAFHAINIASFVSYNDENKRIIKEKIIEEIEVHNNKLSSFKVEEAINPLTEDIYNAIEDCWSLFFHQAKFVEHISTIKINNVFKDRYAVKASIIIGYCESQRSKAEIATSLQAAIGNTNYEVTMTLICAEILFQTISIYANQKKYNNIIDLIKQYQALFQPLSYIINALKGSSKLCDKMATIFIEKTMTEHPKILGELLEEPNIYTILCNSLLKFIGNNANAKRLENFSQELSDKIIQKIALSHAASLYLFGNNYQQYLSTLDFNEKDFKASIRSFLNLLAKEDPDLFVTIFIKTIIQTYGNYQTNLLSKLNIITKENHEEKSRLNEEIEMLVEHFLHHISHMISTEPLLNGKLTKALIELAILNNERINPLNPVVINFTHTDCLINYIEETVKYSAISIPTKLAVLGFLLDDRIVKNHQNTYKKYLLNTIINLVIKSPSLDVRKTMGEIKLFKGIETFYFYEKLLTLLFFLGNSIENDDPHLLEVTIDNIQIYLGPLGVNERANLIIDALHRLVHFEDEKNPLYRTLHKALQTFFSNQNSSALSTEILLQLFTHRPFLSRDYLFRHPLAEVISREAAIKLVNMTIQALECVLLQREFANDITSDTLSIMINRIMNEIKCNNSRYNKLEALSLACEKKGDLFLIKQISKATIEFAFLNKEAALEVSRRYPIFSSVSSNNEIKQVFKEKWNDYRVRFSARLSDLQLSMNFDFRPLLDGAILEEYVGESSHLISLERIAKYLFLEDSAKLSPYCSNQIFVISTIIKVWYKQQPNLQFHNIKSPIYKFSAFMKMPSEAIRSIYLELLLLAKDELFDNILVFLKKLTENEIEQLYSRSFEEGASSLMCLTEKIILPSVVASNNAESHQILEPLPEKTVVSINEKNHLDEMFITLVVEHGRLMESLERKTSQLYFYGMKLNEFCGVVRIIESFIHQEFPSSEQQTTLITQLSNHINGDLNQLAANSVRENTNRFSFFSTSHDAYIKSREGILQLSTDALLVRYGSFREAMPQWVNNSSTSSSTRIVAEIICQQLIVHPTDWEMDDNLLDDDPKYNKTYF